MEIYFDVTQKEIVYHSHCLIEADTGGWTFRIIDGAEPISEKLDKKIDRLKDFNEKIKEDFNPEAFINVNDYNGDVMSVIKKMDTDKSLFDAMYQQPTFTISQHKKMVDNIHNFEEWLISSIKK